MWPQVHDCAHSDSLRVCGVVHGRGPLRQMAMGTAVFWVLCSPPHFPFSPLSPPYRLRAIFVLATFLFQLFPILICLFSSVRTLAMRSKMVYVFMQGERGGTGLSGGLPIAFTGSLTSLVGSQVTVQIRFLVLGCVPGPGSLLMAAFQSSEITAVTCLCARLSVLYVYSWVTGPELVLSWNTTFAKSKDSFPVCMSPTIILWDPLFGDICLFCSQGSLVYILKCTSNALQGLWDPRSAGRKRRLGREGKRNGKKETNA